MRVATYTSRMAETDWLDYFWTLARVDADRLLLLEQCAAIAVSRPADWDRAGIRTGMSLTTVRLTADACFVCRSAERHLYWHHIIQVQHGGSNDPRNFVRICHACHRRLHPWLPAPTSLENRRGWVAVRDFASRVIDAVRAAWTHGRPILPKDYIAKTRQRNLEHDDEA